MNKEETKFLGFVLGVMIVVLVPVLFILIRTEQATDHWCQEHNLIPTTGSHAPTYCYDPKTRLVYKPE